MNKPLVLITGATAGFGKSCAELFAKEGYSLVIADRRNDRLLELATTIKSTNNVEVETACFDVRYENAVNEAISSLPDSV